jgi:hypothetical protein
MNALLGHELFVPVMGDSAKSPIRHAKEILLDFQQGAVVDDVIEKPVFRAVLDIIPFNDETRPAADISTPRGRQKKQSSAKWRQSAFKHRKRSRNTSYRADHRSQLRGTSKM